MAEIMKDYVDVAERLRDFRAKHPEGSIQPADLAKPYWLELIDGQTYLVYAAACYRTATDMRPGIGLAWEPVPGKTSFTRGSELMNAETSAWGRAIVATLAADTKRGVASAQEVDTARRNNEPPKRDLRPAPKANHKPASTEATETGPKLEHEAMPLIKELVKKLDPESKKAFTAKFGTKPAEIADPTEAARWLALQVEPF